MGADADGAAAAAREGPACAGARNEKESFVPLLDDILSDKLEDNR